MSWTEVGTYGFVIQPREEPAAASAPFSVLSHLVSNRLVLSLLVLEVC